MRATLEPTLGLNLLTPKSLERVGHVLPAGLYAPLRWCVSELAEAGRPILRAANISEVQHALDASLAKFAVVRMRFLDFLFDWVGGDDRRLLSVLRDVSTEIADDFLDEAEAVVGKSASLYLAQALALAAAGLERVEETVRATQGFNWTLGADQEITLRTWALRSDALLIICAIGISEPENVGVEGLLTELCRGAYEATARYLRLLERAVSTDTPSATWSKDLLEEVSAEEPQWVHALEANEWDN